MKRLRRLWGTATVVSAAACGGPAASTTELVVVPLASDIESSREAPAAPPEPPTPCVVRGEELGAQVVLVAPVVPHEPWARMHKHVAGKFRLDLDDAVDGRAPLAVLTDTVRLTSSADVASVRFFVPEAIAFGPVVTSMAGHHLRGRPADSGKLRLQLDLSSWLRPSRLFHETACHRARLGGVDYVSREPPDGFDERRLVVGPGLTPLYATSVAAEVALQIDASDDHIVKVRGDAQAERHEVFLEGPGYRVHGWIPATRLREVPEYGLGIIDNVGLGGWGSKGHEVILTCPHEVTLHAMRGDVAFPAATLEPGPEIRPYSHREVAGLRSVRVRGLPFSVVDGFRLGVAPDDLDGCKPPDDGKL